MNQADNEGDTPLYVACREGHTEGVTKLLAAGAVNKANNEVHTADRGLHSWRTPRSPRSCSLRTLRWTWASTVAGDGRRLLRQPRHVKILSSYGARRTFPHLAAPRDTAEHGANDQGHDASSPGSSSAAPCRRLSTTSRSSRPSARALLRAGADIHAAAAPAG